MKCPMCGEGKLVVRSEEFVLHGTKLGRFDTEVCTQCDEKFYSEAASAKINARAKELGLWGMYSKTRVTQSGNALAIRISKGIADFIGLTKGKEVVVRADGKHRIVIEA